MSLFDLAMIEVLLPLFSLEIDFKLLHSKIILNQAVVIFVGGMGNTNFWCT